MPRDRIPTFTSRLELICAEAGLPPFDETKYDLLQDTLFFLWHDPKFCLAAPLAHASPFGLEAEDLRRAWDRKFGTAGPHAKAA